MIPSTAGSCSRCSSGWRGGASHGFPLYHAPSGAAIERIARSNAPPCPFPRSCRGRRRRRGGTAASRSGTGSAAAQRAVDGPRSAAMAVSGGEHREHRRGRPPIIVRPGAGAEPQRPRDRRHRARDAGEDDPLRTLHAADLDGVAGAHRLAARPRVGDERRGARRASAAKSTHESRKRTASPPKTNSSPTRSSVESRNAPARLTRPVARATRPSMKSKHEPNRKTQPPSEKLAEGDEDRRDRHDARSRRA